MESIYDLIMAVKKRGQLDTFGKRARQLRIDMDMRQEDLINAMDSRCGVKIGQSYISELERAEEDRRPSGDVAVAIATVLGTSTDYLFGLNADPEPPTDKEKAGVTEEAELAADMIDTVRDVQRRQGILEVVRLLVAQVHEMADIGEQPTDADPAGGNGDAGEASPNKRLYDLLTGESGGAAKPKVRKRRVRR